MLLTEKISQGNPALNFLDQRLIDSQYRGFHSSQHNRYEFDDVLWILKNIEKLVGDDLMQIRTTDLKKRPKNTSGEVVYARLCDAAKLATNIGTQDAMRKNLFVDMDRMGLIDRFDPKQTKLDPYDRHHTKKFVAISDTGKRLIDTKDLLEQYFIYSKGIDVLLGGLVQIYIEILQSLTNSSVSIDEHVFFVSAINSQLQHPLTVSEAIFLISSYRALSRVQKLAVRNIVKDYAKPKNFKGSKTDKRDFHNWKNEGDQVFHLLRQTVYFESRSGLLSFRLSGKSAFSAKRLLRSLSEKKLYYTEHKVRKADGFELHHIVPLAWSESLEHFKILDSWKNMAYIDGYKHAIITQNLNRNTILSFSGNDMYLNDLLGSSIDFIFKQNIIYSPKNQESMLKYNVQLNSTVPSTGT